MTGPVPNPKSKWPRRLRVGVMWLVAMLLVAMPVGWMLSMIPYDRPEPVAKETPSTAPRTPNVVPPEATLPWTREVNEPVKVVIPVASVPWARDVHASAATINVNQASHPWPRSLARPKQVDIDPAQLPWRAASK